MKTKFRLSSIVLLGLAISCAKHAAQSPQNNQQGNESQPHASAATTSPGTVAEKSSGERGTPAEAKAMLEKAVAHYQEVGRVQALADFNGRKAPFFDRDLYVFCIGPNHIITANGGYPQYVGGAPDVLRDAEGKPVAKAILDAVSDKDEGSVQYRWFNPVSHKIEPKISFVHKLTEDVCGVGAYNPQ
jgi:cytochrome c